MTDTQGIRYVPPDLTSSPCHRMFYPHALALFSLIANCPTLLLTTLSGTLDRKAGSWNLVGVKLVCMFFTQLISDLPVTAFTSQQSTPCVRETALVGRGNISARRAVIKLCPPVRHAASNPQRDIRTAQVLTFCKFKVLLLISFDVPPPFRPHVGWSCEAAPAIRIPGRKTSSCTSCHRATENTL